MKMVTKMAYFDEFYEFYDGGAALKMILWHREPETRGRAFVHLSGQESDIKFIDCFKCFKIPVILICILILYLLFD